MNSLWEEMWGYYSEELTPPADYPFDEPGPRLAMMFNLGIVYGQY